MLTIKTLSTRCEICSELTIKTTERHQWRHSGVFVVNFEHVSHLVLSVFIVNFEQVNAGLKNKYSHYFVATLLKNFLKSFDFSKYIYRNLLTKVFLLVVRKKNQNFDLL